MDFGPLDLDDETIAFWKEVRDFCASHVTEAVIDEEFETGAGFNLGLHKALGERGWLLPQLPPAEGGAGLDPLKAAILALELRLHDAPLITMGTTNLVVPAIRQWGDDDLQKEILPQIARGDIRICLGYSEPDSGSDIAAARTKATRDGDMWTINGQKMFTTGAQNCQYSFLLTRTDPEAAKHRGLTMFLCPLDNAEIRAVHTLGGERTNMVYYDGVEIPDRYRLGPVNQGWRVLLGPLNAEHAMPEGQAPPPLDIPGGLYGYSGVVGYQAAVRWATRADENARRPIDDPLVRQRLARCALDVELAATATGPAGRVLSSETAIRIGEELINLVGPPGLIPRGEPGAVEGGWIEHAHRFGQGTAIYGGTTEIFRNIIAERVLGLPRSTPTS